MTIQDLIRRWRVLAQDTEAPYLWDTQDLLDWFNEAEAQAAVRGRLLREDQNPDVCEIVLEAGKHTYQLHLALYEISDLRLVPVTGDRARDVTIKTREWLDAEMPDWREASRPACWAIQNDTTLRLVGTFTAGDKLVLEGYRLPLEPMAFPVPVDPDQPDGAMTTPRQVPEIHAAHHLYLIHWANFKAYGIPDADTYDAKRSAQGETEFTTYFGPLPDSDLRRSTRADVPHHNVLY